MGNVFRDLWASLQIFYSNFNAKYGHLFNAVVIITVLSLVLYALLRAILAGRKGRRSLSPFEAFTPDPALTEHAVKNLCDAVSIPSVSGDREAIRGMVDFLKARYPRVMKTMDCAETPDGSLLLRWRARESEKELPLPVLFCAHLDVCPGGDGWTMCEPFDPCREDGRIYGRGVVDGKGVLISLMEAAETLMSEDYTPRRDLYFAFGSDEETGGQKGAKRLARTLEHQGIRFDLVLDEGGTFLNTVNAGRSYCAAMIGMGEKRQCEYKITVNCPGGHTCQPARTTAVGVLSEAICRIETAQPHHHLIPLVRNHLDRAISTFTFGKRFAVANKPLLRLMVRRVFRDDPAVMALIRSTIVPTRVDGSFPAANVLPAIASAQLNARLLPGDTPEKILRELQSLLADLPLTVELVSTGEESGITDEKQKLYRLLCEVLQEQCPHMSCIPTLMTASCDARHYAGLSDCVLRFAPIVTGVNAGGGSHMGDEFLDERSVGVAVTVYRALLKKL